MANNILKQGDCLDLLAELKDKSIDLLITDPPYCIGTTSNGTKAAWSDNNLIKPFFEAYFSEIQRVLKDGAEFYINTDWRTYPFFPVSLRCAAFSFVSIYIYTIFFLRVLYRI